MSNEIDVKEKLKDRIKWARLELAAECNALSQHLVRIAEKLESDTSHDHVCINDLGEIQSRGTIIDANCGRLMSKIEVLGMLEGVR